MIISEDACELALVKRGWDEVDHSRELGPCWRVRGAHTGNGYVQVAVTPARKMSAHRAAYIAWKGQIGPGMVVRHMCDNPPCINPEHLLVGTQKENRRDAVERDRTVFGSNHSQSKLTEGDARRIVELRNQGVGSTALSEMFGVSRTIIKKIVNGVLWGRATHDIPRSVPKWSGIRGTQVGTSKLSPEVVVDLVHRHRSGESIRALSESTGVSYQSVWNVLNGKTWTSVTRGIL